MSEEEIYYQQTNQLSGLVIIIILIIAIPFLIKFINPNFGVYTGNKTEGLTVVASYPTEVISSLNPQITISFTVSNPIYDNQTVNFNLCIYNTGLFTLEGSNCKSGSILPGAQKVIQFTLISPNTSQYLNIPYSQQIFYALYYSFTTYHLVSVNVGYNTSSVNSTNSSLNSSKIRKIVGNISI
ncbi:MAG: hypothetical protein QXX36_01785 [Candidatus Rehaiarchaeum fermentans]|nr:hypothetical protein [Candidatus Rehaiarchaeum fermentans]